MVSLLTDTIQLVKEICKDLNYNSDRCTCLTTPTRTVISQLPVRLEDETLKVFEGVRVLHSNALGPGKGGLILSDQVSKEDCQAIALRMTLKCALVNLPLGGSSGLIRIDPKKYSQAEVDKVVRRYVSSFINVLGPEIDIIGPDINSGPRMMGIIMDTYSMDMGKTVHQACTGKPVELGGIVGRVEAMGMGLGYLLHELTRTEFEEIRGQNVVIQGCGNVGTNAARSLVELGANVIAISDSSTGIFDPDGLDIEDVIDFKTQHGSLIDYPHGHKITNKELLKLKCDVLMPCATHNVITIENVKELRCRRIIEGANGAISYEANKILWELNLPVIPDILANIGGVIVSYLEWVQNFQELTWSLEQVHQEMKDILVPVFHRVHELRIKRDISYRTAAYSIAIQKLMKTRDIRGIFP